MGKVNCTADAFASYFSTITKLKDNLAGVVEERVGKANYNDIVLAKACIALDETRDLLKSTAYTGARYYVDVHTNFNSEIQWVENTEELNKNKWNFKAASKINLANIFLKLFRFHSEIVGGYNLDDDNTEFLKDIKAILKLTPEYDILSSIGQALFWIMQEDTVLVQ